MSTLIVYWPVSRHNFVGYDDTDYVTQNPQVQAGFTARSLAWVWGSEVARNWHPVTMLSHMLDCELYGMNAGRHHLTSLLFHVGNTLVLFLLLRRMTGAQWRSAVAAALFALHPLHVESVAWVAERKDVLSTFFFLLTLGAYVAYVKAGVGSGAAGAKTEIRNPKAEGRSEARGSQPGNTQHAARGTLRPWHFYVLSLLLYALGLMSKPMLVTLPFVLLLLDFWPLNRLWRQSLNPSSHPSRNPAPRHCSWFELWSLVREKLPFFALAAASSIITFFVQQKGGAVLALQHLPMVPRLENALVSYVRYLGKMFWPENLAALYLRKAPWPTWEVLLATVFLAGVTAAVLWTARHRRYLAAGWLWYLGTLVPVVGLVQVGMQTMADRYTYIPLIGLFILLAWGAWDLASRWRLSMLLLRLATGVVLAACCCLTRAQLVYWKDGETLLLRMISATEGNYMAHYNLGNLYDRQGEPELAIKHYQAALRIEPNYADAHNNLGATLQAQKRFDEAVDHCRAAVRIRPEHLFYLNLGNCLAGAGKLEEAVEQYQQALKLNPGSAMTHHNLALALQSNGKAGPAIAEFRTALELQPDYESAHYFLANLLTEAGRVDEAVAHYQAAQRYNASRAENFNGLGLCYAMQGKFPEAERQFRAALQLNPNSAGAESNLGNALGAQNRIAEAIPHYSKALQLNPKDFQTHFNLAVSFVRQGQPAEAKTHLLEALRLNPEYSEARQALAALSASGSATK